MAEYEYQPHRFWFPVKQGELGYALFPINEQNLDWFVENNPDDLVFEQVFVTEK